MSSRRLLKINELIRRELNQFFLKELDWPPGVLVTITQVKTFSDLREAIIWLSILPLGARSQVLKFLNKKISLCQNFLDRKLVMRYVPKIIFKIDDTEERAEEIENLLKEIC